MTRIWATLFVAMLLTSNSYSQTSLGLDTYQISRLVGAKGQINTNENVYKVVQPREDLQISMMTGVRVMPAMGLVSWVTFKKVANDTVIEGNLVLTEDQISPVMDIALNNGIRITSLENHYGWETPKVMFMHIEGSGQDIALAKSVGKIFKEISTTSRGNGNFPLAMMDIDKTTLNPYTIESILQKHGTLKNGVYKITLEKKNIFNDNDSGLTTWASFTGSDKEALVIGDLATDQSILNKVLLALHHAGFYIVSIHPQPSMTNSQMVYLHYVGVGTTQKLAKGLRTALAIPIPLRHENKNGLNVYPIITYPEGTSFPSMIPTNGNNLMLNLDISYFNKSKMGLPIENQIDLMNEKTAAASPTNRNTLSEAKS